MPSHRKNNRKGPAKAQTHTHRAHHTHTRQTVGEGSAFTHPVDHDTHKHTEGWFNPVWHRLDLTLNPTRQKFKRHTDKRVRTPTVRQLKPKVQIHTTPLHNKSIQGTYSFTPLNSRHLPTYGTVVRRERTEQSDEAAPNLIHPHPTILNEASLAPFTIQDEGHPTNTTTNHTPPIQSGRKLQATPCINRAHRTRTGKLIKSTKKSQPIKPSFIDARKRHNWECLTPQHFILASLAPNNLKHRRTWRDLMAHTHADRKRLCRRWRYILNRRRHRLQCQETYRKSHYESYTTLDFTTSKLTSVQILSQRVMVLTPNVITVDELLKAVGTHYDRAPRAFYVTSSGRLLPGAACLLPGQDVRVIPRLFGEGAGEKRKSSRLPAKLDVTSTLASLRSLVASTLKTLVPRPDQPNPSMCSEGAQMISAQLMALHQKAQTEHHALRDDIRRLVAAAEIKPLQLLQDDLKNIHVASTPCQGLLRMRPRLFCPPSCRHTEPWESCPNQLPRWICSGEGGPTEEAIGVEQDASAHFLRASRDVSAGTFLTAFGDAAIIRQKSKVGIEFAELYSATQTSSRGVKCQYTYRESTGSDTYWISPHQDDKIISNKASKALKKALEFRSSLKGAGQAAQHSCCTQPTCSTSINAELGLIMRSSGNDDEDECLGAGLFATRAIRTGGQIYVSYSDDISKEWESTFGCRCYCCRCSGTCSEQTMSDQAQVHPTPLASSTSSDPMTEHQSLPDLKAVETIWSGLDVMEVDGLSLAPKEITGYNSSGTLISNDAELQVSDKRARGIMESVTSPTTPKERALAIQYQHYVKETMQTWHQPDDIHTQIVDSFGISIQGRDFATLQANEMLSDGIVDWMCQWWTAQVGGGIGDKAGTGRPQIAPHLPRCYYVSSHWFSKLTEDGRADHQKVARWTSGVNVFQDYDVMLIPIIRSYHWYLGAINFVDKVTAVLDSLESRKTAGKKAPARPETHEGIMTWLDGEHQRITGRPLDRSQWRAINASEWVGIIPRQGTPGTGVGVDCGLFTLAFAMELSLGHKAIEIRQADILAMRNWIAHTMLHYGKQNDTSELDSPCLPEILPLGSERTTSPKVKLSLKRKAPAVMGPRGKISKPKQDWVVPAPPGHAKLRGLRNQGGTCAIIVVLQACFQVPQLTRLLELSTHPQLDAWRSLLARYRAGTGPLSTGTMASLIPAGLRPSTADAGEILTGLLTLFGLERLIKHLAPADTLLSSVRQAMHTRALPPPASGVNNGSIFIVQFDRSDPTGLKIRKRTSYPIVLGQDTYHLACGVPMVRPLTLQAVITHRGQTVTKGHYVVFTKLFESPGWALCDDDKVQWVSEMEVLAQEAFILIYAQPDALQNTKAEQLADQVAATVQPETVIYSGAAHHHSGAEASPLSGLDALIGKMTILDDQPSVEEKSRPEYGIENGGSRAEGVYPHLQIYEERGPLGPLSTSPPQGQNGDGTENSETERKPIETLTGSHRSSCSRKEKRSQQVKPEDQHELADIATETGRYHVEEELMQIDTLPQACLHHDRVPTDGNGTYDSIRLEIGPGLQKALGTPETWETKTHSDRDRGDTGNPGIVTLHNPPIEKKLECTDEHGNDRAPAGDPKGGSTAQEVEVMEKREYQGASIGRKERPLGPPSTIMPAMQIAKEADDSGREQGAMRTISGHHKEKRSQRDRQDGLQGLDDMVTDAEGHLIEEEPSKPRKIGRPTRRSTAYVGSATHGSDSNDSGTQAHSHAAHHQSDAKDCPLSDSEALAADRTTQDDMVTDAEGHLFDMETDAEGRWSVNQTL